MNTRQALKDMWPMEAPNSITMRRVSDTRVEIRRFDALAAAIDGENGQHIMDVWTHKRGPARAEYAEGVLHGLVLGAAPPDGRAVRVRPTLAYLREPEDEATRARGDLEQFVQHGDTSLVFPVPVVSLPSIIATAAAALARAMRGGRSRT